MVFLPHGVELSFFVFEAFSDDGKRIVYRVFLAEIADDSLYFVLVVLLFGLEELLVAEILHFLMNKKWSEFIDDVK